jgi:hypothetical protein
MNCIVRLLLGTLALLLGLFLASPSAWGPLHPEGWWSERPQLPWVIPAHGGIRSVGCAGLVYRDWSPGQPPRLIPHETLPLPSTTFQLHILSRIASPLHSTVETASSDFTPSAVQPFTQSWLQPPVSLGQAARAGKRIALSYSQRITHSYSFAAERGPARSNAALAALAAVRVPALESGVFNAFINCQQFLRQFLRTLGAKTMFALSVAGEIVVFHDPAFFSVGPDQPIAVLRVLLSWLVTGLLLVLLRLQFCGPAEKRSDHSSAGAGQQSGEPVLMPLDLLWIIASCTIRGRARLCKHRWGRLTHSTRRAYQIRGPSVAGDLEFFGQFIQDHCSLVKAKVVWGLWVRRCRGLGMQHAPHFCNSLGSSPCITSPTDTIPVSSTASCCHSLLCQLMHWFRCVRPAPCESSPSQCACESCAPCCGQETGPHVTSCCGQATDPHDKSGPCTVRSTCVCHSAIGRLLSVLLFPLFVLMSCVTWLCVLCKRLVQMSWLMCKTVDRLVRLVSRVCCVLLMVFSLLSVVHTPTMHTYSTNLSHTSWLGAIKSPSPNVSTVVMKQSTSVTPSCPAQTLCPVNSNTTAPFLVGPPAASYAAPLSSLSPVRTLLSSFFTLQCIDCPLGGISKLRSRCIPLGALISDARVALGSAFNQTRWLSPGHWFPSGLAVAHPLHLFAGLIPHVISNNCQSLMTGVRAALLLAGAVMMLSVVAGNCNRFITRHSRRRSKSVRNPVKLLNCNNRIVHPFWKVSSTASHSHDPAQLDCLVRWIEGSPTSAPENCPEPSQCSAQGDSAGTPPAGSPEPGTGSSSLRSSGAPLVANKGPAHGLRTVATAGRCQGAAEQPHADSAACTGNSSERARQVPKTPKGTVVTTPVVATTRTESGTAAATNSAAAAFNLHSSKPETETEQPNKSHSSEQQHVVDDDEPLRSIRAVNGSRQSGGVGSAAAAPASPWLAQGAAVALAEHPNCDKVGTTNVLVCAPIPVASVPCDPTDNVSSRTVRIAMARDGNANLPHILKITATKPLQLHDQIMEWRDAAFQHLVEKGGKLSEISIFYAFRRDLGPDHIYNSIIDSLIGYDAAPHMTVKEVVLQIIQNFSEQRRQQALSRQHSSKDSRREAYLEALDSAYIQYRPFQPSPSIERVRASARRVLDAAQPQLREDFEQAWADLAAADEAEATEREAHFALSPGDKSTWLLENSPAGSRAVEARMKHYDMMHGSAGSSSSNNPPIPASLEDMPYRSPEDMYGINWLIEYCTYRSGGFSRDDIARLRSEQMGPNETPRQAAARVIRHADVLAKAGLPGFDKDFEVWSILTTRDREGGAFVTTTLFDNINPMVQVTLDLNGLKHESNERVIQIWIDTAETQFGIIRGSNKSLYDRIIQEAQRRKNNKDKPDSKDGKSDGKSDGKTGGKQGDKGNGKDDKRKPNMDKNAGQYWCSEHGFNKTHGTAECRVLLDRKKRLEEEYQEVNKALTTIAQPGADLSAKGQRPNALYQQGQAPPAGQHAAAQDKVKCNECSRIAGKPIWHVPGTCYMAPGVPVPASFRPTDLGRLKVVNDKRTAQGLAPWDSPAPVPPRRDSRAMAIVATDPTASNNAEETFRVCMFKQPSSGAGLYLQPFVNNAELGSSARKQAQDEQTRLDAFADTLQYVSSTKRFYCRSCKQFCTIKRDDPSGDLLEVSCGTCKQTWAAPELPSSWASPSLWRSDGTMLASLMATPSRSSSRAPPPPPVHKLLESLVPWGPFGPTPAQIQASSTSSTAAGALRQPDLVSSRLPVQQATGSAPQVVAPASSSPVPRTSRYPFTSVIDQLAFCDIVYCVEEEGKNPNPTETQRILATLGAESRTFHEGRLTKALRAYQARLPSSAQAAAPTQQGLPHAAGAAVERATLLQVTDVSAQQAAAVNPVAVQGSTLEPVSEQQTSAGASISLDKGLGAAPAASQHMQQPMMTTPDHTADREQSYLGFDLRLPRSSSSGFDLLGEDNQDQEQGDDLMPFEYVPRTEFEAERRNRLALDDRVKTAEDRLTTAQTTLSTLAAHQPIGLMDDRFTDWVSRVADLRLQMTRVCRETGIDPGGLVSGSRFDALDDEVARVRSRVIALEQRPAMMPTYSSAVAPLPRTSGNDAKVLVAEMEARLTHTYATAQALEQVSKAAELASSDLRILQAQCKLDVSTLNTESASILEKVREQGTDVAAVRAQYTGLADQVALLRTMAASTQQGAPASSSVQATQGLTPRTSRQTFEDIDELRKKLEGLQVSDLRQRVDGLGVDDLRKQVEDLAQEVAHLKSERDRLESELRQVTTVPQAQPAASTSDIDALRATVEQVSADLADLRVTVEAQGTSHSRLIAECATNDAWHSVCDDIAGKVSLADLNARLADEIGKLDAQIAELNKSKPPRSLEVRHSSLCGRVLKLEAYPLSAISELQEWAKIFQHLGRDWHQNLEHDLNFLWEQVKFLKDDAQPGWRQVVNYLDPPSEVARIVLNKRMINEKPVVHGSTSIRNYGSPNEPEEPYNDPSTAQLSPTHTAVNPLLADAALQSTRRGLGLPLSISAEPQTAPSDGDARMDDARASSTPKRRGTELERIAFTTALPEDSDSVGGTSTEVANALALASTSGAESPLRSVSPSQGVSTPRGNKTPRTTVAMMRVDTSLGTDTDRPCTVARTAADLSAPAWGHPDFDLLSLADSATSPQKGHAVFPIEVTPALRGAAYASSSEGAITEMDIASEVESIPELNRFSPGELAALTAMFKDDAPMETPEQEYARRDKELREALKGVTPGTLEHALAINRVLAPGTTLQTPARPDPTTPVVAPAIASEEGTSATSSAGEADVSDPDSAPARQGAEPSRKTKRNRANKRRRRARADPLSKVPAALEPRAPRHVVERMGENFCRTPQEEESHHKFFGNEATSIMLQQPQGGVAALHLLNADQTLHIKPANVMVDNGADLSLLISPHVASRLNISWKPGSANLVGIGGPSAGHSHADEGQQVVLRLGNFTGARSVGPWDGCHIVGYRPIIMSESTARDIGCDVILGQRAMRTCLASVDQFREKLDFSPAWYSHGCAAFRCSIPVTMSRPINRERKERHDQAVQQVRQIPCSDDGSGSSAPQHVLPILPRGGSDWGSDSFSERLVLPIPATSPASSSTAAATAGTSAPPTVATRIPKSKPVSAEKHPNALPGQGSNANAARAAAATPHPGFPQTPDVPSREQMADVRERRKHRSRRNRAEARRREAEARTRTSDRLSTIVAPAVIGYPVKELQSSGRLLDGFRLDPDGGTHNGPHAS